MATTSTFEPLLDASWTRVDDFVEAGPSDWLAQRAAWQEASQGERSVGDDSGYESWEYSEEEELVTLDLGPDTERIVRISDEFAVTGLETSTPFLQLGSLMFKGKWDKLIGTEILLRQEEVQTNDDDDEGDGSYDSQPLRAGGASQNSSTGRARGTGTRRRELRLRPLPPSSTNIKRGTAPSTTRHRIQFAQASNMAAKEAVLSARAKARYNKGPTNAVADATQKANMTDDAKKTTGLVERKGYVWVRGHGWVRKDQTPWLKEVIYGKDERGDEEEAEGEDDGEDRAARRTARVAGRRRADPIEEGHASAQARDSPAQGEASVAHQEKSDTAKQAEPAQKQKRGRPRVTQEEKAMHAIWMGLRKFHMQRKQPQQEEERDEGENAADGEQAHGPEAQDGEAGDKE